VFANILLADEINRATPKTQSALLEAMQEYHITTGGDEYQLDDPFFVLATQNPIEMEGTYPLPEAQLDRFFFKIRISYPEFKDLETIADLTTSADSHAAQTVCSKEKLLQVRQAARKIIMSPEVKQYAIQIVLATHADSPYGSEMAKKYIRYGASPRGLQALILGGKVMALKNGRFNLSYEDIRKVALAALRHRILLNFEGEASNIETDQIITEILKERER
jgi:MoxR-like ATPase